MPARKDSYKLGNSAVGLKLKAERAARQGPRLAAAKAKAQREAVAARLVEHARAAALAAGGEFLSTDAKRQREAKARAAPEAIDFGKTRPDDLPRRPGAPDQAARDMMMNMAAFGLSVRQISRLTGYTYGELRSWYGEEIANAPLHRDLAVYRTLYQQATGDGDWTRADGRSTRFWAERKLGMTPPASKRYGEDKRVNLDLLTDEQRDELERLLERAVHGDPEAQIIAGELSIGGDDGEVAKDAGGVEAEEAGGEPGSVDVGGGGSEGQDQGAVREEPD